jgi:hypothetical protein
MRARGGESKSLRRRHQLSPGDAEANEAASGGAGRGGHAYPLEFCGFFENGFDHPADLAPAFCE